MLTDRRSFLQTSVMLGCAAATGETVLRKADSVSSEPGPALIERISWMNAPASFRNTGHALVVRSKDFIAFRQGYFPPNVKVEAGIRCAAPEGPGFDAAFDPPQTRFFLTLSRARGRIDGSAGKSSDLPAFAASRIL